MKTEKTPSEQIKEWLDSNRNYTEGVILFQQFGKNPTLKKLLPGREYRYAEKLAYELSKLVHLQLSKMKMMPGRVIVPERTPTPPQKKSLSLSANKLLKDSIPKSIAAIIVQYSKQYKLRSILHASMKKVAPDNRADNVQKRKEISQEIANVSEKMENLHHTKTEFEKTGKLPEQTHAFDKAKTGEPAKINLDKIKRQRSNLMKSILKSKNRLDYQSPKKKETKNPMPKGPRRTDLESKIKLKEIDLASCNRIIANDPR